MKLIDDAELAHAFSAVADAIAECHHAMVIAARPTTTRDRGAIARVYHFRLFAFRDVWWELRVVTPCAAPAGEHARTRLLPQQDAAYVVTRIPGLGFERLHDGDVVTSGQAGPGAVLPCFVDREAMELAILAIEADGRASGRRS